MKEQIRTYINENLLFGGTTVEYTDDSSLLELGIIDSVGVMELVLYVEESYGVHIEDDEIVPDNFDSVTRLANYIRSKQTQSS